MDAQIIQSSTFPSDMNSALKGATKLKKVVACFLFCQEVSVWMYLQDGFVHVSSVSVYDVKSLVTSYMKRQGS